MGLRLSHRWYLWIFIYILGGCGDQIKHASSVPPVPTGVLSTATPEARATLPDCALDNPAVPMPEGFPVFPMPDGSRITESRTQSNARVTISGVIPGTVDDIAAFWERELRAAGYEPSLSDAEPGEAEGLFIGNGYRVRWILRSLSDCDGAAFVQAIANPN
jgi:hypothetical protein